MVSKQQPVATLIGDLVGSRKVVDRRGLQATLDSALTTLDVVLKPLQPLEFTVGDEFQGKFASLATAVRASLVLRLWLLQSGEADSRYGLGFGEVTVFEGAQPGVEDGPGWWSARAAIEQAESLARSPRTAFVRTALEAWPEDSSVPPGEAAALNAFLVCRDAIVEQMSQRARRLLLGLTLGRPQAELATAEDITQSAVSQGLARSGAFALEAAQQRLEGELP